jgi:hypothetical protein
LLGANELEGATARLGEALLDGFELLDGIPEGVIEVSVFDPVLGDGKTEGTPEGTDGAMLAVG